MAKIVFLIRIKLGLTQIDRKNKLPGKLQTAHHQASQSQFIGQNDGAFFNVIGFIGKHLPE